MTDHAPAARSAGDLPAARLEIWRTPPHALSPATAAKGLAELNILLRPCPPEEEGSSGSDRGARDNSGHSDGIGEAKGEAPRGAESEPGDESSSEQARAGEHGQAKGAITLVLQLEIGTGQPAPSSGPVFTNALVSFLADLGGQGETPTGAGYRPAVRGFADQRLGRWKDQSQLVKAGWRLKAARLLLDPAETALVTLNLPDEEVAANDGAGHHLSHLAGTIRKRLLRTVFDGAPASFVGALELHQSRTGAAFPINPAYGAHVHLVIQVPADRARGLEEWLLRYVEKAHGMALRRYGQEAPKLRELRGPDGATRLRLDLPGRTVSTAHLRLNGTGLAANLAPVDPDRPFRRTGRYGLEGLLDYLAKDLHRLSKRLRACDLRCGEGPGGRHVRAQPLHASADVDDLAERLYMAPDAAYERLLAQIVQRQSSWPAGDNHLGRWGGP